MTTLDASRPGPTAGVDAPTWVMRSDMLEAAFLPTAGGRMVRLRHAEYDDLLVPFSDTSFDVSDWPKSGAFPLFPFHNRLRNAKSSHAGRVVRLKPGAASGGDVMHGPAHLRAWRVSGHGPAHIEMTLDYPADADWPFDFSARQRFELAGSSLTVGLSLRNTGRSSMPGGVGWHPYFKPSCDGRIRIDAERQWNPFGPRGLSEPIAHEGRDADRPFPCDVTQHYSGWAEAAVKVGDGATITLAGDAVLTCLAALRRSQYLCLEPVSHVAGALELFGEARTGTGLRLLASDEEMTGIVRISVT